MSKGSKTSPFIDSDKKWRAESDLRTLREAEEIRSDKSRVSAAQTEGRKQMAALSRVTHAAPKPARAHPAAKRLAGRKI